MRARAQDGQNILPRTGWNMVFQLTTVSISQNNSEDRDYLVAGTIHAIFTCGDDGIELEALKVLSQTKKSCFKNLIGIICFLGFFFAIPTIRPSIHPLIHPAIYPSINQSIHPSLHMLTLIESLLWGDTAEHWQHIKELLSLGRSELL